ncbi:MAG: AMP-binding protein [bacterium]|nr:AMP-binding protein [bacterium]
MVAFPKSKVDEYASACEGCTFETRADLEEFQLKRLNELLERIGGRGLYAEYPTHLSSLADIANLPFTTERDIIDRPSQLGMVSQSQCVRVISDETSATTGKPKRIYYTQADRDRTTRFFEIGLQELIEPGDFVMLGFPESGELGLTDLIEEACRRIGAMCYVAEDEARYAIDQMSMLSPNAYIGHPFHMTALLDELAARDTVPTFTRALISGDSCSAELCEAVAAAIGSYPFLHYGSREIGLAGAVSCSSHKGMHIRENDLLVEIVDGNGNPLPDGEWGEIVITTLAQEAMPFVRYRTQDRGRIIPQPCECSSVMRLLDDKIERM